MSSRAILQHTAPASSGPTEERSGKCVEFRELYLSHFGFVLRTLRRLGVPEADALDLAQKVFWVAHLKLPKFEYRSSLSRWLFVIALNMRRDYGRLASIRREVATDFGELDQLMGTHDELRERDERLNRLAVAVTLLNRLSDEQREVFVLFELEGFSGAEIAHLLGIPLGTVRSRLRIARESVGREVNRLANG
ncbi:MAG TPA: sigma-70 family RNA polymerase sigma factor [Polyangiaceae bacterium]|nr:sigma-70 family RNA polymerase sigma factor [Polyangiaceae bacterium]